MVYEKARGVSVVRSALAQRVVCLMASMAEIGRPMMTALVESSLSRSRVMVCKTSTVGTSTESVIFLDRAAVVDSSRISF